jgi:MATE family multidrug resistance protein
VDGRNSTAASSFANIFYYSSFFGIGISYAITPLVARQTVAVSNKISEVLRNGSLNLCIGTILVTDFAAEPFMHSMNQPKEVVDLALPYLSIIAVSIIPP